MNNFVGLKELREHTNKYVTRVRRGESFIVMRRSEPVFKVSPIIDEDDDGKWETIIDFTKIKKGGVPIEDVLAALKRIKN